MKQATQDKTNGWNSLLNWFVPATTEPQPKQVLALQWMLIGAIVLSIIYAIGFQLIFQSAPTDSFWLITFFAINYGLSRTQLHRVASLLLILGLLLYPHIVFSLDLYQGESLNPIIVSTLPIPLVMVLFDKKMRTGLLMSVSGFFILSLLIWTTNTSYLPPLSSFLFIILSFGMLIAYQIINKVFVSAELLSDVDLKQRLVELSPDLTALVVKGKFTYINPAGMKLLGVDNDSEIIGKSLNSVIFSQNIDTPSSNQYRVQTRDLDAMTVQSFETIIRTDGETFGALVTFIPFEQEGNLGTLLTAKPVPKSINQVEQMIESAPVVIAIHQNDKVVFVSSQFERLTGYSREEIYSSEYTRFRFTYEEDRERLAEWIDTMHKGTSDSKPIEHRMYRKDGSLVWVSTAGSVIRYGGQSAVLTTTTDISLYRSKPDQYDFPFSWFLVKNVSDELRITDYHMDDFNWFENNAKLVGKSLSDIFVEPSQNLLSVFNSLNNDNMPVKQRNRLVVSDGHEVTIEWTATRLIESDSADFLIKFHSIGRETQLEDKIQHYQAMFNMMNDYAFLLRVLPDNDFEFAWVSDSFKMITGYDPKIDSTVNIMRKLRYADDIMIHESHIEQLIQGEMSVSEHRILTKSGEVRWIREYAYPVVENSRTTYVYGTVRDISHDVKVEEAMKNNALQQAVVAEIGLVAARGNLDIEEFVQQAISLITHMMIVPWCVLIEYHRYEQNFTLFSIIGDKVSDEIESKPDDKDSYLGYVLHQNDPVVIRDWSKETRFKPPQAYVHLGIQSSLSVVVPMQDRAFGILNVHDVTPRQFTGEHINLLQTVANIIGAYIQQQRTQIAEREHRLIVEALSDVTAVLNSASELDDILHLILGFVSQIVPVVDSSNIMLLDNHKQLVTIAIRYTVNPDVPDSPPGREIALSDLPLFVQMMETGQPIVINNVPEAEDWHIVTDTAWIQSYLGAPIFAGDECIGIVNLDSARPNAFTSEHVKQMQAFLDQASIAVRNARQSERLVKEVENRTQELQSERAQFQAILNSTGEGIFYARDKMKNMMFLNRALADMMGYEPEELLGQSSHILRPDDLTEDELQVRADIENMIRTQGIARADIRFKRKDGTTFMGGITASLISQDDEIPQAVTIIRDISKEKEIESQKETFISNAAHELRGPITTLNTRMYILKNKEHITKDEIDKMDVVVQKMNALIAGLLDLSRFESGRINLNLQSIILQTVIDEVMEYQLPEAEKKHMTLKCIVPDEPITMIADPLRLNQVLTNLVSNSINYTEDNGTIEMKAMYTDNIFSTIRIEVSDNGIGIDADSLSTIFQPFSQAHNNTFNKGTGLGLSISKQIVEAHGGSIEAHSVEGEGSHFILYLPTTAVQHDNR